MEMPVAQELLHNLWGPVKNENAAPFGQNVIRHFKLVAAEHLTKLLNQTWDPVIIALVSDS